MRARTRRWRKVTVRHRCSIREVMICWTPPGERFAGLDNPRGNVGLVKWPASDNGDRHWQCTAGACDLRIHDYSDERRGFFVMSVALGLIVNYDIDPQVVHKALWPIDEYRFSLPEDSTAPRGVVL
jgi:hypothetical protein